MRTKLPPEYVAAYKRYIQGLPDGMTIYDISAKVGRSPSTVYHALAEEGIDTTSHRKRKQKRNAELVIAYQAGQDTLEEVGGLFGITKQRAQQIVAREAPNALRRKSK